MIAAPARAEKARSDGDILLPFFRAKDSSEQPDAAPLLASAIGGRRHALVIQSGGLVFCGQINFVRTD